MNQIDISTFDVKTYVNDYSAKKTRWDAVVGKFLEMHPEERRQCIAKLIMIDHNDVPHSKPLFETDKTDVGAHAFVSLPRLRTLVAQVLEGGGRMTAKAVWEAIHVDHPTIRKNSIETVVSRMASKEHKEILYVGKNSRGIRLYRAKRAS